MLKRIRIAVFVGLFVVSTQATAGPPKIGGSASWWQNLNPLEWELPSLKLPSVSGKKAWRTATAPFSAAWDATKSVTTGAVKMLTPPPPEPEVDSVADFLALPRPN